MKKFVLKLLVLVLFFLPFFPAIQPMVSWAG